MSATLTEQKVLKGGEFLIKDSNYQEMFIPEDFNEEQHMVKEMCLQFLSAEVKITYFLANYVCKKSDNWFPRIILSLHCIKITRCGFWSQHTFAFTGTPASHQVFCRRPYHHAAKLRFIKVKLFLHKGYFQTGQF